MAEEMARASHDDLWLAALGIAPGGPRAARSLPRCRGLARALSVAEALARWPKLKIISTG